MTLGDNLRATLVVLIWGLNFVVIELGMDGVPPLLFVAIRFVLVAFPAVLIVRRPELPWRTIIAVGLFMSLGQFGFLYTAIAAGLPSGLAALVLQAQVIFTIVIAAGALRAVPTTMQLAGVLIATAGLAVVGIGRGGATPLVGLLLCLCAALSWAVGNVIVRAAGTGAGSGLRLTVWSALVVPAPAGLLALAVDGPDVVLAALAGLGPGAVASTLYTAVLASLVGYGLFNGLLARHPAAMVVPWVLAVPPIAILAGWVVLGQLPAPAEAVGGAVMLAGVLVAVAPWERLWTRGGPGRPSRFPAHSQPGRATLEHGDDGVSARSSQQRAAVPHVADR